jgi:TPR repeat protein
MTLAVLDGMDAKDWAGVHDRLAAALAVDGWFVPALMLIRALRSARPSVFKQGDITIEEATMRIWGASTEAKERGKRFVESLGSPQSSSTSGSRMFLMGFWDYWLERGRKAARWYRKAAGHGNADAQFNLGWCFQNGEGVEEDPTEAVKWYRMAAEQEHADAQFNLGVCFHNGRGVTKDPAKAVKWWRKAAEQGHADAQNNLGVCFMIGEDVAEDPVEAVKWYHKAAEHGHADA